MRGGEESLFNQGLAHGGPWLRVAALWRANPAPAAAQVAGLRGVKIETILLDTNQIGDAGLRALVSEAASLKGLRNLSLSSNQARTSDQILPSGDGTAAGIRDPTPARVRAAPRQVTDRGLRALVEIGRGALPALELIWLDQNLIGDAGLQQLTSALAEGEVLPMLEDIYVEGNPASPEAQAALKSVLSDQGGAH